MPASSCLVVMEQSSTLARRIANPWPGSRVTILRNGSRAESVDGDVLHFPSGRSETIELVRL